MTGLSPTAFIKRSASSTSGGINKQKLGAILRRFQMLYDRRDTFAYVSQKAHIINIVLYGLGHFVGRL
jgi:hypothetical protein